MKLKQAGGDVERIGVTGETNFNIEHNAKAFEILSSGLYTDPILAVVRELSCNAYDAHVAAGKGDIPFSIHLPSKLEPYFSVIDDGTGLSDENVRGLYSTYFASDKTDTNDQIGGFGLGSKSPFSYSKAFDVISRWNGTIRTYSVFVNEDGVPTIAELAKCKTDRGNGIEVKIAARENDYHTFQNRVANVLRYFPVKPIILGHRDFEFTTLSDSASITDEYIIDRDSRSGLTVVQGNVPYKVSTYHLDDTINGEMDNFINNHNIVLFFDIGMIDIAANREEVRYDEDTVKNIVAALSKVHVKYLDDLNIELNELTAVGSRWDVYNKLDEKFNTNNMLRRIVGKYKFDSKMVNDWIDNDGAIEYTIDWKYHKIVPYQRGNDRAVKARHSTCGFGGELIYQLYPKSNIRILHIDIALRSSMRMNTILGGYGNRLIAIVPITDRALANNGVVATNYKRTVELNKIVRMFGSPTLEKLSEVTNDVVPEHKRERKTGHTFRVYRKNGSTRHNSKPVFEDVAEPTGHCLYIQIDQLRNIIVGDEVNNWTGHHLEEAVRNVLKIINAANGTNYQSTDIFGLTKKVVKAVKDEDNWASLSTLYAESLEELKSIVEYYARIENSSGYKIASAMGKFHFHKMVSSLPKNSKFRKVIEPVIKLSADANKLRANSDVGKYEFKELDKFNTMYGIKLDINSDGYFSEKDLTGYDMLAYADLQYSHSLGKVADYIKLVEKNAK